MSMFDRLSKIAGRLSVSAFGEAIVIRPTIRSDFATDAPDPSRPVRNARAVVSMQNTDYGIEGARRGTQMQGGTVLSTRATRVYLPRAAYAALGYEVRQGDIIELTDPAMERGGTRYSVTRVVISDTTDVVIELVFADAP